MEAQDLRIGNLVTDEFYESFNNTIIKVESINESGINLTIKDDGNWAELASTWIEGYYLFDKLKPIPLTEGWVIRLGGEIDPRQYGWVAYIGKIKVSCSDGEISVFLSVAGTLTLLEHIKYVHQIQNLSQALTGEELTINQ